MDTTEMTTSDVISSDKVRGGRRERTGPRVLSE